jgi:hypothetical protein
MHHFAALRFLSRWSKFIKTTFEQKSWELLSP